MTRKKTYAFIGRELLDSSIEGSGCDWALPGGDPNPILKEHYKDPTKVATLLTLGHISVLRAEIGEKHDFNSLPIKDLRKLHEPLEASAWTTAYHRDCDKKLEKKLELFKYPSMYEISLADYERLFVYTLGHYWMHRRTTPNSPWLPL